MKRIVLLFMVVAILLLIPLVPTMAYVEENPCNDFPDGHEWHPGIAEMCLKYEIFWNCGFDIDCGDDYPY